MVDYNVRFDFLLDRYCKTIFDACSPYLKKMRREEIESAAMIGLFYADITCDDEMDFKTHIYDSVSKALALQKKRNASEITYFSLNRPLGFVYEFVDIIQAPNYDWDLEIMVSDYLSKLAGIERSIAIDLLGNAELLDILKEYKLSLNVLKSILFDIQLKWKLLHKSSASGSV